MATLSEPQLATLRAGFQAKLAMNTTKPVLNTAFQEIEDWFEANRSSLGAAITGPFTAGQKRALLAFWLHQKFGRENV